MGVTDFEGAHLVTRRDSENSKRHNLGFPVEGFYYICRHGKGSSALIIDKSSPHIKHPRGRPL